MNNKKEINNIVFIGPAGCGKTTAINKVNKLLKIEYKNSCTRKYVETEKYTYLYDFYNLKDKTELALLMQIDFLTLRLKTLIENANTIHHKERPQINIFDRYHLDDYGYMKMNHQNKLVTDEDFKTYEKILKQGQKFIESKNIEIDYIFVLKVEKVERQKRILSRGRGNESTALESVIDAEDKFFFGNEDHLDLMRQTCKNVITINANASADEVAKEVMTYLKGDNKNGK